MKTVDYIEALRKHTKTGSDYAVANLIGASRQKVSGYKNKGVTFSDEMAVTVAHILDLPEAAVMADMHAERANCTEVKTAWQKAADVLRKSAAVVMVITMGLGATNPAPAEASSISTVNNMYYAQLRRRVWAWMSDFLDGLFIATGLATTAE